jgi:hypothetical protein
MFPIAQDFRPGAREGSKHIVAWRRGVNRPAAILTLMWRARLTIRRAPTIQPNGKQILPKYHC